MPKAVEEPIDFNKNTDGMMPIYSGPSIPLTACRQAKNINLTPIGGFSSRYGYIRDNTSAQVVSGICTGLYEAIFSNGTHELIGTCDAKIGVRAVGATSWTDKTGVLTITAGQNNLFSFAMLNDIVVCCNDTDTCIQVASDFTTAVLAGSPAFTSALFNVEYRSYMFVGNTVETGTRQPDLLRFSANNDPGTWTSTNFITVAKKNGGTLRGAIVFRDQLLCFKENNIYAINFQPTRVASDGTAFPFIQNPTPIAPGIGSQSHRTLVRFTTPSDHQQPGEYIFFLDQYGMPRIFPGNYSYGTGTFQTVKVGYPISNCRDSLVLTLASMTKTVSVLRSSFAVHYPERNQIWLFMSQTTQMDTCWVLDYTNKWAWTFHKFADAFTCGALVQDTTGIYRPFTCDRNGFTVKHDTSTGILDNTTAIPWFYETGDIYKGSTSIRCNWPFFEARGTAIDNTKKVGVSFIADGNDIGSVSNTISFGSAQPVWGTPLTWGQFNWAKTGTISRTLNPKTDAKTLRTKFSDVAGAFALVESFSHAPIKDGTFYE